MLEINKIYNMDCLEGMKLIDDGSIDLIVTDPPYGIIKNFCSSEKFKHGIKNKTKWDIALNPEDIFKECERILRENGILVLFSKEPYTSKLITEAHNNLPFLYRMVWIKDHFANGLISKKAPVSYFEDIIIFAKKYDTLNLNPLRIYAKKLFNYIGKTKKQIFKDMGNQSICHFMRFDSMQFNICTEKTYNKLKKLYNIDKLNWFKTFQELKILNLKNHKTFNLPKDEKIKSNVLYFKKDYEGLHPTQKPLELLKDLIKTYSNEEDIILDFTNGSGTTTVACKKLNRNFIGFEIEKKYCDIANKRLEETRK